MAVVKAKSKIDSRKVINCKEKTIAIPAYIKPRIITAAQAKVNADYATQTTTVPSEILTMSERIATASKEGYYGLKIRNQTNIKPILNILKSNGFKISYKDNKTNIVISWQ